jgi:hypothetical protein
MRVVIEIVALSGHTFFTSKIEILSEKRCPESGIRFESNSYNNIFLEADFSHKNRDRAGVYLILIPIVARHALTSTRLSLASNRYACAGLWISSARALKRVGSGG